MPTPPPLIVSGSLSLDRIMNFSGRYRDLIQADKLHVLSLSVLIDSLQETRGGTAGNICYSSALLGDHPILLATIGKNGTSYLSSLARRGVDTTHVIHSRLPTATFTVLTDSEDNQIGGFYPGAMDDYAGISLRPFESSGALVVVSPNAPALMRRLVEESTKYHLTLAYDPGQQVTNSPAADLVEGVRHAHLLFVNDYELGVLSSRTGISIPEIRATVPLVITTLGKAGATITGREQKSVVAVGVVPNVVPRDPTGAGDAFRAGFLYAYRRNLPLPVCGKLGSCLAAYTVERVGTQTHHPTRREVMRRYQAAFGAPLPL